MRLAPVSCTLLCLLLCAFSGTARGAAPDARGIEHLEPANWWIGMHHHQVELMVHGRGIAALTPKVSRAGIAIIDTQRTTNPNYLFVTVDIAADAKPGTFDIEFLDGQRVAASHPWRLDAREKGSAQRRGFDARDAIYLVTPDRFANGDSFNDSVEGMRERASRGDANGRHGGDISGIRQHLDYIAGMGFTQLWPTPLLENDQPRHSYHGYAITDLYRTDPRMGHNEDYRALSRDAKSRGIGLIMDVVLNHIGSEHWWMRDLPSADWINNGGRFAPTNHRRTTIQDPHAAAADREAFVGGWFVESMPDLNQRDPHLATYLIQNTLWWIEYAGLSGIREDTFGYADTDFLSTWAKAVLDEYPGFSLVGEEWSINPAIVAHWQRGKVNRDGHVPYMPSMMDFPLHIALRDALLQPEGWDTGWVQLYEALANDFQYPDPGRLVVFAENHDTPRLLAHLNGDIDLWKLGMAQLATVRGTPQFYYGSEVLLAGPRERNDGELRADMPGGWIDDTPDAFSGKGLSAPQRDTQDWLRRLLNWRKNTPVMHDGQLTHYAPVDGVYVYVRHDDTHKPVLVALNKNPGEVNLPLARFNEFLRGHANAVDVMRGRRVTLGEALQLPGKSATILELQ